MRGRSGRGQRRPGNVINHNMGWQRNMPRARFWNGQNMFQHFNNVRFQRQHNYMQQRDARFHYPQQFNNGLASLGTSRPLLETPRPLLETSTSLLETSRPLLEHPRWSSKSSKQPSEPARRSASPLPGSEEYTQRNIQQASEFIKRQLNIEGRNNAPHNSDVSKQPNDSNARRLTTTSNKTEAFGRISKKAKTPKSKNKSSEKPTEIIDVNEIHEKIIKHISKLSYSKKINLVNQGSIGYDIAIHQIQKQQRLELSRALRDMSNRTPEDISNCDVIKAIIPDFGIKIEDLPREIIAQLSNTLDIEFGNDCLTIDPGGSVDPIVIDEDQEKNGPLDTTSFYGKDFYSQFLELWDQNDNNGETPNSLNQIGIQNADSTENNFTSDEISTEYRQPQNPRLKIRTDLQNNFESPSTPPCAATFNNTPSQFILQLNPNESTNSNNTESRNNTPFNPTSFAAPSSENFRLKIRTDLQNNFESQPKSLEAQKEATLNDRETENIQNVELLSHFQINPNEDTNAKTLGPQLNCAPQQNNFESRTKSPNVLDILNDVNTQFSLHPQQGKLHNTESVPLLNSDKENLQLKTNTNYADDISASATCTFNQDNIIHWTGGSEPNNSSHNSPDEGLDFRNSASDFQSETPNAQFINKMFHENSDNRKRAPDITCQKSNQQKLSNKQRKKNLIRQKNTSPKHKMQENVLSNVSSDPTDTASTDNCDGPNLELNGSDKLNTTKISKENCETLHSESNVSEDVAIDPNWEQIFKENCDTRLPESDASKTVLSEISHSINNEEFQISKSNMKDAEQFFYPKLSTIKDIEAFQSLYPSVNVAVEMNELHSMSEVLSLKSCAIQMKKSLSKETCGKPKNVTSKSKDIVCESNVINEQTAFMKDDQARQKTNLNRRNQNNLIDFDIGNPQLTPPVQISTEQLINSLSYKSVEVQTESVKIIQHFNTCVGLKSKAYKRKVVEQMMEIDQEIELLTKLRQSLYYELCGIDAENERTNGEKRKLVRTRKEGPNKRKKEENCEKGAKNVNTNGCSGEENKKKAKSLNVISNEEDKVHSDCLGEENKKTNKNSIQSSVEENGVKTNQFPPEVNSLSSVDIVDSSGNSGDVTSTNKDVQISNLHPKLIEDIIHFSSAPVNFQGWTGSILVIKTVADTVLAGNDTGLFYFYDIDTGSLKQKLTLSRKPITSVCVGRKDDDKTVYIGSLDGTVHLVDRVTYEILKVVRADDPVQCMDLSWGFLFLGSPNGNLIRYELKRKKIADNISISDSSILMLSAIQEGARRVILVATRNCPVTIRDAMTGLLMRTMQGVYNPTVYTVLFHNCNIYCGTSQHDVLVYTFHEGLLSYRLEQGETTSGVVSMNIVKHLLFAGCYNGNIYVYNTLTKKLLTTIEGPGGLFLSMEVTKNKIVVGTKQNNFRAWNLPTVVLKELL